MEIVRAILLPSFIVLSMGQLARAEVCGCVAPGDSEFARGLVWQGSDELGLADVAALVAPILWFSPDEPLLLEGMGPLPHAHPCDPDQSRPVVYYQLRSVRLTGDARVSLPVEDDTDFWSKVARLTLRFYFYYPEDRGTAGHYQDLEVAELELVLENTATGCHRVRLLRVTGFAHGLDWYYNELEVEPDTRFPLTLLVEEGKHASCPDRNADGVYTPGYDVNRRVNDAWGVRDVFGSGIVGVGGFSAAMVKPRQFRHRVGPAENPRACVNVRNSSFARSDELMARYDLRPATRVPACEDMGPDGERLLRIMAEHGFGPDHEPRQSSGWELGDLAEPLAYSKSWRPPISLRRDRDLGLGVALPAVELGEFGYLVPRVNYIFSSNDVSVEAMLTPSASQFLSWYVSSGAAYEHALIELPPVTIQGETWESGKRPWGEPEWNFVAEVGVKLRARMPGKWRILSLGYHFAGIRLGFRNSGVDNLDSARIIVEIGAGIF